MLATADVSRKRFICIQGKGKEKAWCEADQSDAFNLSNRSIELCRIVCFGLQCRFKEIKLKNCAVKRKTKWNKRGEGWNELAKRMKEKTKNDSHKRNKMRNTFNLKTFPVSKNISLSKRFEIAIWFVTNKKTCFIDERIYATVTTSHSMKHQPRFSQIAVNMNSFFSFFQWIFKQEEVSVAFGSLELEKANNFKSFRLSMVKKMKERKANLNLNSKLNDTERKLRLHRKFNFHNFRQSWTTIRL